MQVRLFIAMLGMLAEKENVMSKFMLITTLITALLVSGCSLSKPEEVVYTPIPLEGDWSIKMYQSGGIMGLRRNIELKSDGNYTVTDERTGKSVKHELTQTQVANFQNMINAMQFTAKKSNAVCADCFIYSLEIQSNGQKMTMQLDDMSLPDSGMQPLVDSLRKLMDNSLK